MSYLIYTLIYEPARATLLPPPKARFYPGSGANFVFHNGSGLVPSVANVGIEPTLSRLYTERLPVRQMALY